MANTRDVALGLLLLEPHGHIDWSYPNGGIYFVMDEDNELDEYTSRILECLDWTFSCLSETDHSGDVWSFTK